MLNKKRTSRKFSPKLWKKYYDAENADSAAPSLLRRAIPKIRATQHPRVAVDLGCGTGADTLFLLKKGYTVCAIDAQRVAIARLRAKVPLSLRKNVITRVARFEALRQRDLPRASLINASFSIFFCRPSSFFKLWRNLTSRLEPGGVFCGQFLGLRDGWARRRGYTALSKRKLVELLAEFEVIKLSEVEKESGTRDGRAKHWHYFTVTARKRGATHGK